ncbi:trihelix transcription factor GT-1 isoform X2 [Daucus carota subsp. sativus]|uniref:trihelix transcription factor GT-1 isoform X2 n=1 Tax=Daucus carota subsp. sativus TaxID=79200 RepID=UPI0007EF1014|nr:PREDICTED: trihelix transcription factor GT-1-like isoform X1 [Daucus carota subsp. sativus]
MFVLHKILLPSAAQIQESSMDTVPNPGFGSAARNGNQLGNGAVRRIIPASGPFVLVRRGREERRIGVSGSYKAIREAIRCAFGLQTKQEFCLQDEYGILRPLDRNLQLGTYELVVNPGVIMTFCYARDPNHSVCEVYTKTLATQADLSDFLDRNHWIGLVSRGDTEIIDIMDDLQNGLVYHGLNKMWYP